MGNMGILFSICNLIALYLSITFILNNTWSGAGTILFSVIGGPKIFILAPWSNQQAPSLSVEALIPSVVWVL